MTNSDRKRAIRARMTRTGETYTQAMRAIEAARDRAFGRGAADARRVAEAAEQLGGSGLRVSFSVETREGDDPADTRAYIRGAKSVLGPDTEIIISGG